MKIVEIAIIGIVFCLSIIWQLYLIQEKDSFADNPPKRLIAPAIAGVVIFAGVTIYGIISMLDMNKNFYVFDFAILCLKSFVFGIILLIKSYLGPLVLGFSMSFTIYYLFEYKEFRPIPIIQSLFEWCFTYAPSWASYAYAATLSMYVLSSSIFDTTN